MDWGLLQTSSVNFLLRDKLSIKRKWVYYIFVVSDFFLRLTWILIISPDAVYRYLKPEFVFMILYSGEGFRRSVANFVAVEFEHINLCNSFRATHFIESPFYLTPE